jgi:hypothetical protein
VLLNGGIRLLVLRSLILPAIVVAPVIGLATAQAVVVDPLANGPVDPDLFTGSPVAQQTPISQPSPRQDVRPVNFELNAQQPAELAAPVQPLPAPAGAAAALKNPCAAIENKPLNQLGISIAEPAGKLPTDMAAPCWAEINGQGSPGAARCWPVNNFNWNATCFYHNPLYFEEANLERYGYQCGDRCCCCTCGRECCLQPAASAAHFYGALLALPYCMFEQCPGDCVYTLGHYRPGDCNPWRCIWPAWDPCAALAAGGIWTGLVFAIP